MECLAKDLIDLETPVPDHDATASMPLPFLLPHIVGHGQLPRGSSHVVYI